ncbi:MAG: glycosyltransferase family 1 protein [Selenomonadaceae bacterium]|nr:glycosyltransferase family 1 protein [Selenomonadaceae bacterium]
MIRVLQIIGIVCGGGVEAVIMNYYRHIDRSRVQFDFVIDGYEKSILDAEIEALGGKVYRVEPYRKNIFRYMWQIYDIIRVGGYDIVHSNMNTLSGFSLLSAYFGGVRVRILHNHSTATSHEGMRTVLKVLLRPFARLFANRYVACSHTAGIWMYGRCLMNNGGVKILNNAVDTNRFSFSPSLRQKYRSELGVDEKTLVIGHIGRFMYQKNHEFLIDVFRPIHAKHSNTVLLLIGDGERRKFIEQKVKDYGLEKAVRFLGLRNDVAGLYNAMDLFMLPSWYEGLPVVAVEAQANGLRCVFSDRVTRESKLLDSTEFHALEEGAPKWAEYILHGNNVREDSAIERISAAGFDIKSEAKNLVAFYEDNIKATA